MKAAVELLFQVQVREGKVIHCMLNGLHKESKAGERKPEEER